MWVMFVLMGCFQWGSRLVKTSNYTALDKSYEYDGDVIIIGAGAAGLAAARYLKKMTLSISS